MFILKLQYHNRFKRSDRLLPPVIPILREYPLEVTRRNFIASAHLHPSQLATTREEYLGLAESIVRAFLSCQGSGGEVIDSSAGREIQYSTPAFACVLSFLLKSGRCEDLLEQAEKAINAAVEQLVLAKAPERHEDFFTVFLMDALSNLEGMVSPAVIQKWRDRLSLLAPNLVYRENPRRMVTNWNLVAITGEWLRYKAGISSNRNWIENCLSRHSAKWTAEGLYNDKDSAIAYDCFARYHLVKLLSSGYDGPLRSVLQEISSRGAWTSLLMQSPCGEAPTSGRSGHHQWNESAAIAVSEYYASLYARENQPTLASAFKRAARLGFQSLLNWRRSEGDLFIVKNRYEPALRHGFERYSNHTCYNLLAAVQLCQAAIYCDDSIPMGICPAETGGFSFLLHEFDLCVANFAGTHVLVRTACNKTHNPAGLIRIHKAGISPQLSMSDGVTAQPAYSTPGEISCNLSISAAWQTQDGTWHRLADCGREPACAVEFEHHDDSICISFVLVSGGLTLRERIEVKTDAVTIRDEVDGAVTALRQYIPLFRSDGVTRMQVTIDKCGAKVIHPEGKGSVLIEAENRLLMIEKENCYFRNGVFDIAFTETTNAHSTLTITLQGESFPVVRKP